MPRNMESMKRERQRSEGFMGSIWQKNGEGEWIMFG
jgi:hypothetical protein